ncbi:MAG: nitroreductase family protein [Geobacteraceae bacterium]|nr:nitroreductase family protein [Geobacteraceae bacterium]
MDVMDAIKARKSVRAFLAKTVEDEKLDDVLQAARLAPSAANLQEWRFVIVREPDTIKKLAAVAGGQAFVTEAPVVIVACAETDGQTMRWGGPPCYQIDVAIALDHMSLAAVDLGLGSCWIGLFDDKKVKEILNIPVEIRVIVLMLLGYPSDPSVNAKNRLPVDRIVKYEHW